MSQVINQTSFQQLNAITQAVLLDYVNPTPAGDLAREYLSDLGFKSPESHQKFEQKYFFDYGANLPNKNLIFTDQNDQKQTLDRNYYNDSLRKLIKEQTNDFKDLNNLLPVEMPNSDSKAFSGRALKSQQLLNLKFLLLYQNQQQTQQIATESRLTPTPNQGTNMPLDLLKPLVKAGQQFIPLTTENLKGLLSPASSFDLQEKGYLFINNKLIPNLDPKVYSNLFEQFRNLNDQELYSPLDLSKTVSLSSDLESAQTLVAIRDQQYQQRALALAMNFSQQINNPNLDLISYEQGEISFMVNEPNGENYLVKSKAFYLDEEPVYEIEFEEESLGANGEKNLIKQKLFLLASQLAELKEKGLKSMFNKISDVQKQKLNPESAKTENERERSIRQKVEKYKTAKMPVALPKFPNGRGLTLPNPPKSQTIQLVPPTTQSKLIPEGTKVNSQPQTPKTPQTPASFQRYIPQKPTFLPQSYSATPQTQEIQPQPQKPSNSRMQQAMGATGLGVLGFLGASGGMGFFFSYFL